MKLEVDLNDKAQLERVEMELERSLKVIRAALEQHRTEPAATPLMRQLESAGTFTVVSAVVQNQPNQFDSSRIYNSPLVQTMSRESVKSALARLVENKIIKVHLAGKGRRPTIYEKVSG